LAVDLTVSAARACKKYSDFIGLDVLKTIEWE